MDAVKLLFLDFDGTFWPFGTPQHARTEELSWLLEQCPQLQIVVSSNWRISMPLETLKTYFPADIRAQVIGTLALEDDSGKGGRQLLIEEYLASFTAIHGKEVQAFVALDDLDYLYEEDYPYLVCCKNSTAMEMAHMERAYGVLKSQLQGHKTPATAK